MYSVEVYNAYFGDCMILKTWKMDSEVSNLLVDFGIHRDSIIGSKYGNRKTLTDKIADDIYKRYSKRKLSLLITHFHEDHVSGLIRMYNDKAGRFQKFFENVYIADIWGCHNIVASFLLEELLMKKLSISLFSLFDLLDFLSVCANKVITLSKGDKFEDENFITLWPKEDDPEKELQEIIADLNESNESNPNTFKEDLKKLSKEIGDFFSKELISGNRVHELNDNDKIDLLRKKFDELLGQIPDNCDDKKLRKKILKLNKLNHKYNIVFQNTKDEGDNILFTGDVETEDMCKIASDTTSVKLHDNYEYIKIPHHGTQAHYFDYSEYNPRKIIIPNGRIGVIREKMEAYRIYSEYRHINAFHLCTNSNNCRRCYKCYKECRKPCSCIKNIVFPRLFMEI